MAGAGRGTRLRTSIHARTAARLRADRAQNEKRDALDHGCRQLLVRCGGRADARASNHGRAPPEHTGCRRDRPILPARATCPGRRPERSAGAGAALVPSEVWFSASLQPQSRSHSRGVALTRVAGAELSGSVESLGATEVALFGGDLPTRWAPARAPQGPRIRLKSSLGHKATPTFPRRPLAFAQAGSPLLQEKSLGSGSRRRGGTAEAEEQAM